VTFTQPFTDYEILERLGSGAMGTVFKARQKRLARIVALKVLRPSLARNARFVERLRREARIVASLNHPGIVAGYDLGEEGGYHFFVMEYVDGKSLAALLKEWGMFPEEQVLNVALGVAAALDHAWRKGVIHRDVKPGNIIIDARGRPKLTDMGLAKAPDDVTITREGATVGTPQYISPEQARDPATADIRSDLYSLGATLYHMCTGQPPFPGDTIARVIQGVLHDRAPSVAELNPGISDGISLVIRKLLAKDPAVRYQTPAELLLDLERVQRAERPQVDEASLERGEHRAVRGGRAWRRRAAAAAGVAVIAAGALLFFRGRGAEPSRAPEAGDLPRRTAQRLADASGYRGKLAVLAEAEAAARSEAEVRAIADLRSAMVLSWQEAVRGLARTQAERVRAWCALPENWRVPERFVRQEVLPAIERGVGVARAELPPPVAAVLDAEVEAIERQVQVALLEMQQALVEEHASWILREVSPLWLRALQQSDFVEAERTLRERLPAFFAEGSGRPQRGDLPAGFAAKLDAAAESALGAALLEIERAERSTADDLLASVEGPLTELRESLRRSEDPRVLRRHYRDWRDDLLVRYPPRTAFRPGADPWNRVTDALRAFESELAARVHEADTRRVRGDAASVVAALLTEGHCERELQWLARLPVESGEVLAQRDRYAALFRAALAARERLLSALLGDQAQVQVQVGDPAVVGRKRSLTVRRERDGLSLAERDHAGRGREVSLAQVLVSELLDRAGDAIWEGRPPAERADLGAGLALWLYLAGEGRAAGARLEGPWQEFFGQHALPLVREVLRQRLGDESPARAALVKLQDYQSLPVADLRVAYDDFVARFGESATAAINAQLLGDLQSWLAARERDRERLERLKGKLAPGLDAAVLGEQRVRVFVDPQRGQQLSMGPGWSFKDDALEFAAADVSLADAGRRELLLEDHLGADADVRFETAVAFPPPGDAPRLYLFEIHGAGIALGFTAAGEPIGAVLPAEHLLDEKQLQRALERELERVFGDSPPPLDERTTVVPHGVYALRIEVAVQPQRLAARVVLEGRPVVTGSLPRPGRIAPRVRLLPLQPVKLRGIELRGAG
jgi:serine/threonine-protein kinase